VFGGAAQGHVRAALGEQHCSSMAAAATP